MTRNASALPLRAFFAWLETNGAATAPRRTLVKALGAAPAGERALEALSRAGILQEGPPAVTLPCGEGMTACAREVVRVGTPGEGPPYLATCGLSPRACETLEVEAEELRQLTVSATDLARVLRELMGVVEGARADRGTETVLVGDQERDEAAPREVVLVLRPRADAFEAWLEGRARGARETLVLVPTARVLTTELAARHRPGARVEVDTLADVLSLKDGALVLAPRLRPVRSPPSVPDERAAPPPRPSPFGGAGSARRLPKVTRWQDVRFTLVDNETVSVEIAGRFQRLTFLDLGLAGRSNRKPTKAWALLVMCCEGQGMFRWKPLGSFENARQIVARLRKALRAYFELEDDPFHAFNYTDQWRTKFRAGVEP